MLNIQKTTYSFCETICYDNRNCKKCTKAHNPIPPIGPDGAFLTIVMLTEVTMTTVRTVSAWLAGQVLIVFPRTSPVFIPADGTLAPIQI